MSHYLENGYYFHAQMQPQMQPQMPPQPPPQPQPQPRPPAPEIPIIEIKEEINEGSSIELITVEDNEEQINKKNQKNNGKNFTLKNRFRLN